MSTDFERWAKALAQVESGEKDSAWGDHGFACGCWQMHPAFVHDYMPEHETDWRCSWHTLFVRTLHNFWFRQGGVVGINPLTLAMRFHLGVSAVKEGQWDQAYAERFTHFYAGPQN